MIGLYLLAAHLVGDFVLQTRWQAATKLTDYSVRCRHVLTYAIPFVPIAIIYGRGFSGSDDFMFWLVVLHFATDSRRFLSSLGDVIGWQWLRRRSPALAVTTWIDHLYGEAALGREPLDWRLRRVEELGEQRLRWPTPNPWRSMPILIDQSLHVAQLALLGGLFLR